MISHTDQASSPPLPPPCSRPQVTQAIDTCSSVQLSVPIVNTDRSTCGRVAGAIAKKHGDVGFTGSVDIT